MVIKIGINGFGRIGRVIFRTCLQNSDIQISAINDPAVDIEYICYLIKYDSTHGKFKGIITRSEQEIEINGNKIKVFREKLPTSIPWQIAGVQYVIEASGMFTSLEKASGHLASDGVKRVLVTAPSVDVEMIILGVNNNKLKTEHKVISCASSTLYCLAPIIQVLESNYGVAEGFLTSIHAMTPSLKPLDGLCVRGKHWRDHRSIHQNIIPAITGACKALGKIIPQVKDKLSGLAFRVPIVNVSVLDISIRLKKSTTLEDIANNVEKADKTTMRNIIKISNEEVVSSDFVGDSASCVLDVNSSLQLSPDFFKLICWYENEYSYACRVLDSIFFSENQFHQLEIRTTLRQTLLLKPNLVQENVNCRKQRSGSNVSDFDKKPSVPIIGYKVKPHYQPLYLKKPISLRSSAMTCQASMNSNDSKKKNEIFKVWNDVYEDKCPTKQNRNSFFHSCMSFDPDNFKEHDCKRAKERLEKVKKEFSKMVNKTEDLLRKTYSNNIPNFITNNAASKETLNQNSDTNSNYTIKLPNVSVLPNYQKGKTLFDVSGDFSNSLCTIHTKMVKNNISTEKVRYCDPIKYSKLDSNNKQPKSDNIGHGTISVNSDSMEFSEINSVMCFSTLGSSVCVRNDEIKPYDTVDNYNPDHIMNENRSTNLQDSQLINHQKVMMNTNKNKRCNQLLKNEDDFEEKVLYVKDYTKEDDSQPNSEAIQLYLQDSQLINHQKVMMNTNKNKLCNQLLKNEDDFKEKVLYVKDYTKEEESQPNSEAIQLSRNGEHNFCGGDKNGQILQSKDTSFKYKSDNNLALESTTGISFAISTNSVDSLNDNYEKNKQSNNPDVCEKSINNMEFLKRELQKRNVVLVKDPTDIDYGGKENIDVIPKKTCSKQLYLTTQIIESLDRFSSDYNINSNGTSRNMSPIFTNTRISNCHGNRSIHKQDLYDKLDSASTSDSENSFQINEKKSQIINITDLSNSFQDLARLDKICRIIEISDELSDKLFSALENSNGCSLEQKKWSFKDLCERIKLDEFCNKVFGKSKS